MAATRLIAMHINKGKTLAQCIRDRTDYAKNPEKTKKGELVSAYACDPMTVDEEFLLAKRQYQHITGRHQKNDVIAYQIRQSFKPGEVTPEEANRIGYELGMRFTKGKHAFIVATHTDRAHIHNHVIFNSTTLDGKRKFVDFFHSGLALQKVSDIICVEHGLSMIKKKSCSKRTKRTEYPKRECFRDRICEQIDAVLAKKPGDFEAFLKLLEQDGYEIKRGKYTAVRGKGQQRFVRFRSLGEGYSEEEIRAAILGEKVHRPKTGKQQKDSRPQIKLLVDIDTVMQQKGIGYQRWATVYNLKQMAQTMIFIREHGIESLEQLKEKADESSRRFDKLNEKIKTAEKRLNEIASLKTHMLNYSKTRDIYAAYRKTRYNKEFFEEHREAITLHKAAKEAFNQLGLKKLPKVKELNVKYSEILTEKKADYAEYRKVRTKMQEYQKAKKNVEMFFQMQAVGKEELQEKNKVEEKRNGQMEEKQNNQEIKTPKEER